MLSQINLIEKDLNKLKETININKDISELKSQIFLLKEMITKNKKGQIDPRWILIIILIILTILFLMQ